MKTYGFVAPVLSLASSRNKPVLFSRSRNVVRRTAKRDCNTIIFMSNKAQKFVAGVAAVSIALCSAPHVAFAVNRPDLLPSSPTPVIDLAKIFPKGELKAVEDDLNDFEQETGWRIRIVASVRDATPGLAVKDFWNLKDPAVNTKTVVVLANPDAGNILNFSVGDEVYSKLPRPFWVELTNRYGNQFDVKRLGQDKALLQAVEAVKECLQRTEGCRVVPGIGQDQYALTLITSAVGGFVAGFAGRTGQREGVPHSFNWPWVAIFFPLWGILFGAFGIGPVILRTHDITTLLGNVVAFITLAVGAYKTSLFVPPPADNQTR